MSSHKKIQLGSGPAPSVSVWKLGKQFGALKALDDVTVDFHSGCFHAILGENGAGKSTLVKCMLGFYKPTTGSVSVNDRETEIRTPREAHKAGLGMVYQHFTLVPSMSVAENLVLGLDPIPSVVAWRRQRDEIAAFIEQTPFRIDPDRNVASLAAGEKQKLEILKQLYLGRRFIVLDEPTSVLTPDEADQILGLMRELTDEGALSVVLITHKLREVQGFAREVSVLRGGRYVGGGPSQDFTLDELAEMMVGRDRIPPTADRRASAPGEAALEIGGLEVDSDRGVRAVRDLDLHVRKGEILGVAGVSGNGQRELVETLAGQREPLGGTIRLFNEPYRAERGFLRKHGVFLLSEEPLHNSAVKSMSVAENLALRNFDRPPWASRGGWFVRRKALRERAEVLITEYGIRTQGPDARLDTLSGGNVQRCVLARELSEPVSLLITQNPCFGLDLAAVAEIRNRIVAARNTGAAVLLISEDLDEILQLSDRIVVMFDGEITYETTRDEADIKVIGRHMAAHEASSA